MSNLHNTIEYINSLSQSDPKELIDRSEQRFKNIIRDVSDKVENDSGLQVVMLAGPSASGKTTTAQKLAEEFTRRGMKHTVFHLMIFILTEPIFRVTARVNPTTKPCLRLIYRL